MPTWLLGSPNPTATETRGQLDGSACLVREQRAIVFLPTNDGRLGWGCASIIVSAKTLYPWGQPATCFLQYEWYQQAHSVANVSGTWLIDRRLFGIKITRSGKKRENNDSRWPGCPSMNRPNTPPWLLEQNPTVPNQHALLLVAPPHVL